MPLLPCDDGCAGWVPPAVMGTWLLYCGRVMMIGSRVTGRDGANGRGVVPLTEVPGEVEGRVTPELERPWVAAWVAEEAAGVEAVETESKFREPCDRVMIIGATERGWAAAPSPGFETEAEWVEAGPGPV